MAVLKKIFSVVFTDFQWKLLSLGLALVLWFIGMNYNNPSARREFTRSLDFLNEDVLIRDNIVILNKKELLEEEITVGVRAPKNDLDLLNAVISYIKVSIDFRAAPIEAIKNSNGTVKVSMDVYADIFSGYDRMYTRPLTVEVEFDNYVRKPFIVQIVSSGEVREGCELQHVTADNLSLTLSGPKSFVDTAASVRVGINIQDGYANLESTEKLYVYDKDGNDITRLFELSVIETNVRAFIYPYKTVPLRLGLRGSVEPGYTAYDEPIIKPEYITITALPEILHYYDEFYLYLDLNSASETIQEVFDLREIMPQGLFLTKDQAAEVLVVLKVEKVLEKEFVFPISNISIMGYSAGSYQILSNEPVVRFAARGPLSIMENLNINHIEARLNLRALNNGTHTVPLTFVFPDGVSLMKEPPLLEVMITHPDEIGETIEQQGQTDPDPLPAPSPTPEPAPEPTPDPPAEPNETENPEESGDEGSP